MKKIFLYVSFTSIIFASNIDNTYFKENPNHNNIKNTIKLKENVYNDTNASLKLSHMEHKRESPYEFIIDNEGVSFKSLNLNEQILQDMVLEFGGEELEKLQDIVNVVAYFFQINGYPAATAYIPQQDINDKIQIHITLGVLGDYIIKNSSAISDKSARDKLNLIKDKGKIVTTKLIENAAYRVNEMSGIKTQAALQNGLKNGQTDVVLELTPDITASALFYADNYGTKESGIYRAGVNLNFNNTFSHGDKIDIGLQNSNKNQINYNLAYTDFIGNLQITPNISQGNYTLGGAYKNANFTGLSKNIGFDASYPLYLTSSNSIYFVYGFYHKKLSDTRLVATIKKHSNTFNFGFNGVFSSFNNKNIFSYSAKIFYGNVKDEGTEILGIEGKTGGDGFGKFAKTNINLNNSFFINENFTHISMINFQHVIGGFTLDSSESATLGGAYGIRAYENGIAEGDNAISASFGLRYQSPIENLYFTPFYDVGYSWYENKSKFYRPSEKNFLDALGLEILYNKENDYYLKLDMASAITKYKLDDKRSSRIYFSFGKFFVK